MIGIYNFIRGYVKITVRGYFPERFLNICSRRKILLWNVKRCEKTTFCACVSVAGFLKLRPIAKKSGCRVKIIQKRGLPFFVNRIKKRRAFISGGIIFAVLVYVMTLFVWVIDIKGNKKVQNAQILSVLEESGLYAGRIKFLVDADGIKASLMQKIPSLSYVGISLKGTTCEINIRERETLPEKYQRNIPCDIIASESGVIEEIYTKGGMQLVKKGDTVVKGEVLVSGIVTTADGRFMRYENSEAKIYARTWHEFEHKAPYVFEEEIYTGNEKTKHSIKIFNFNVNFFIKDGISYPKYDIIESSNNLKLADKINMPFYHTQKTYREIKTIKTELTKEQLIEKQTTELKEKNPDLQVLSVEEQKNGEKIRLIYECIENIAHKKSKKMEDANDNGANNQF